MLGPYGGTGGVGFDSGNFTAKSCYLGYISGKAGLRLDQLSLHWSCPWGEPEFSVVEPPRVVDYINNAQSRIGGTRLLSIFVISLLSLLSASL